MKLGQILVQQKACTAKDVEEALTARQPGERIGQALVRLGRTGEDAVLAALGRQSAIPVVDLATATVDAELIKTIPLKAVYQRMCLPLKRENGTLTVAIADPLDTRAVDELRLLLDGRVEPVLARAKDIERLLKTHFGVGAETVERMIADGQGDLQVIREEDLASKDDLELAEDASLIKFVNQFLLEAIQERASDIHIEPMEKDLRIRMRVDGVLHRVSTPPQIKRFQAAIISRLKIMANLNIAEKRLPQDGRIKLRSGGREVDIRVSIIPNVHGEGVVLRLLDRATMFLPLPELGMPAEVFERFERIVGEPHGILLVTGPTGSGKSTTLYAGLQKINAVEDKIITVEDPVEYQLDGVKQIQVNAKIGLTFANALRSILRHDPDIIMIGEIRDLETAEIAVQSALTGHLVLSTLHTNDAASAVTRLIDMGIEPFLVASSVEGLLAQRLLRSICPSCKEEYRPANLKVLERVMPPEIRTLYHGAGCEQCHGTGYRGRSGLFELFLMDDAIREMVLQRAPASTIKRYAIEKQGMRTLRMDAWDRVRAGQTTPEEVLRMTKEDRF
jgi:general secretion pathway protein E/type IV pilus assembly protein PilB